MRYAPEVGDLLMDEEGDIYLVFNATPTNDSFESTYTAIDMECLTSADASLSWMLYENTVDLSDEWIWSSKLGCLVP